MPSMFGNYEIGANSDDGDKHFRLMADIDLSAYTGTDFSIIGYYESYGSPANKPFTGVFEGNGKKISNFSYTSTYKDHIGLFGFVEGENATIKDLRLIAPNIFAQGSSVGGLVGELGNGRIIRCYMQGGSISGNEQVGGLVGYSRYNGRITDCTSSASVSGNRYVGGLVGRNRVTITHCYATGTVDGNDLVGGLVGENGGNISDCNAVGNVSGDESVGGLVGDNWGTITDCFATSDVDGNVLVGGLVGQSNGTITNSYAEGDVDGNKTVGGLVGINSYLFDFYAIIANCYSTGSVAGTTPVGGLVGCNDLCGIITDCYSVGGITGTTYMGGLVGSNHWDVFTSFWDIETSGQTTSAGGTGKTTSEMQMEDTFTFAGWDFVGESENGTEDIWSICEGTNYPRLVP